MVVTPCACDGDALQSARHRVDTIFPLVRHDLGRIPAIVFWPQPQKAHGHEVVLSFFPDQIGSELQSHKLIVRHIAVHGIDQPVTILPGIRVKERLVIAHDVRLVLGVSRDIQPQPGPPRSHLRRSQQSFHNACIRAWLIVGQKSRDLVRRRRQSRQIKRHPTNQRSSVGLTIRLEPLRFQFRQHEVVGITFRPACKSDFGQFVIKRILKGPELATSFDVNFRFGRRRSRRTRRFLTGIKCAVVDPMSKVSDDSIRQLFRGRHFVTFVTQCLHDQTAVGIPKLQRRTRLATTSHTVA